MKDPLDVLEHTYRQVEPDPDWEEKVRRRLAGRGWGSWAWIVVGPVVTAGLAYAFLLICQGTPSASGGVPREVLDRQMAHVEPTPAKHDVSSFQVKWI